MKIIRLVLVVNIIKICIGYRILLMFPFPFRSHGILGEGFVRHLINAGHEVTYISPYSLKNSIPNLHEIVLNTSSVTDKRSSLYACLYNKLPTNLSKVYSIMFSVMKATLADKNFLTFLNDETKKYDLVIIEWMFSDIYSGLSAVFQCPFIWFFTYEPDLDIMRLTHELPSPAISTNARTLNLPPLSFVDRLRELWFQIVYMTYRKNYIYPQEDKLYQDFFESIFKSKGRTLPAYDDVRFNASFTFSNSHISILNRHSNPMNFKSIGGYHINEERKDLPKTFRTIMDNSTNGVIIFSMGSKLDSRDMPAKWKMDILNVFENLNQTVLWKTKEKLNHVPSNVKVFSWFPQQQILAHKNCILLITHGGLLSVSESVYHGVPIIGIPAFADQFLNMKSAEKNGYGKKVDLSLNMASDLDKSIRDVLKNPRYATKAKERSILFHDRQFPSKKELIYWVEYVIRTQGAPHLRSNAFMLPWYRRCLEFCILLVILIFVLLFSIQFVLKIIYTIYSNFLLKLKIKIL